MNSKQHWENIYNTKKIDGVSWYQEVPEDSLKMIQKVSKNNQDKIIDIGCGKGFLADNLLRLGYSNISLLDISKNALDEVKARLGFNKVNYIDSNILDFKSNKKFDIWHDRAVFHFLTNDHEKKAYRKIVSDSIINKGYLIIAAFSEDGPLKCSGLEITRYSLDELKEFYKNDFEFVKGYKTMHKTPFDTNQSFNFSVFKKTAG
jgi:predicted TPR repeat methyltransferase